MEQRKLYLKMVHGLSLLINSFRYAFYKCFIKGFDRVQMKRASMLLILIGLLLLVGCGKDSSEDSKMEESPDAQNEDASTDDFENIVEANDILGFKLLEEIDASEDGNVFVSPASLFMALSVVYNGATGTTQEGIAEVLEAQDVDQTELNAGNLALMKALQAEKEDIDLEIANSLWMSDLYEFTDPYKENIETYYDAQIEKIDMMAPESVERMNDWVEEKTHGKIKEMIDGPLDADSVGMIMNAVYFNGNWTYPFDEAETEEDDFHLVDSGTKTVPFMTLHADLDYTEREDMQIVRLPYGEKEEMSMFVFLPNEDEGMVAIQNQFNKESYAEMTSELKEETGTVRLPKFELEYEINLNNTLKNLGMNESFGHEAQFTEMIYARIPIWMDQVKQKTYLNIDEEGTEAAAVTSTDTIMESAPEDEPFTMNINRPFYLTIVDEETEMLLFVGRITNP